jgi:uncharacterized protein YbjT (DUF2867 family)
MQMPLSVLVLGATGNVGTPLVEALQKRDVRVRAAIRKVPIVQDIRGKEKAGRKGTSVQPIEYIAFNYFDPDTYSKAMSGVDVLYLLTPVIPEPLALVKSLLEAAKKAGIKKVVRQSAFGANRIQKNVRLLHWHHECEKAVVESGVPYVILRPTGFFQNYFSYAEEISSAGVFHMALGSDRSSYIDARDVAQIAAVTLCEDGHEGREYDLTGPQALSNEDIADLLSDATGDQIKFVPISDEVERRDLIENGMPDWLADGLVELHRHWRGENAAQVLSTIRDVTRKDSTPFEKFARENVDKFRRREAA